MIRRRVGSADESVVDGVRLPDEVVRDISPDSSEKKKSFLPYFLAITVMLLSLGVYFFFIRGNSFEDTNEVSLENMCSRIDLSFSNLLNETCIDSPNSLVKLFVKRGTNDYTLQYMNFIAYSSSDYIVYSSDSYLPKKGTHTFIIDVEKISDLDRVELIPTLFFEGASHNCSKISISSFSLCSRSLDISDSSFEEVSDSFEYLSNERFLETIAEYKENNPSSSDISPNGEISSEVVFNYQNNPGRGSLGESINPQQSGNSESLNNLGNNSNSGFSSGEGPYEGSSHTPSNPSPSNPVSRNFFCDSSQRIDISSCEQLQDIRNNLCGNYFLTKNIDCSSTKKWNYDSSEEIYLGFEPLGESEGGVPFTGKFNGQGYSISNLYINRPDDFSVGLFGILEGDVSNVKLVNVNISGNWGVGAVAGEHNFGSISKASSSGIVTGWEMVGGLVGEINSYDYPNTLITQSFSSVNVFGESDVGGFVGSTMDNSIIRNCYSKGNVVAENTVGGFVGSHQGVIENSYSLGDVTADFEMDFDVGGFVGFSSGLGSIKNSYFVKQKFNQEIDEDYPFAIEKSVSDMKKQSTYSGWDFANIWKMSTYPELR